LTGSGGPAPGEEGCRVPVDDLPIRAGRGRGRAAGGAVGRTQLRSAAGSGAPTGRVFLDRLSVHRALAVRLVVRPHGHRRAYDQLLAEGLAGVRRGFGPFVTAAPRSHPATPSTAARPPAPLAAPRLRPAPSAALRPQPRPTLPATHRTRHPPVRRVRAPACWTLPPASLLAVLDPAAGAGLSRAAPPPTAADQGGRATQGKHPGFPPRCLRPPAPSPGLTAYPGQLLATLGHHAGCDELAAGAGRRPMVAQGGTRLTKRAAPR